MILLICSYLISIFFILALLNAQLKISKEKYFEYIASLFFIYSMPEDNILYKNQNGSKT